MHRWLQRVAVKERDCSVPLRYRQGQHAIRPSAGWAISIRQQATALTDKETAMVRMISLTVLAPVLLAACAMSPQSNDASPSTVRNGVLVGPNQMTLYVLERDVVGSGKSACTGMCATNWPPLVAPATAQPSGQWSVVQRDDGTKQWAYQGRPLYYWSKDAKPGDMTGEGMMNNAWRVAKP